MLVFNKFYTGCVSCLLRVFSVLVVAVFVVVAFVHYHFTRMLVAGSHITRAIRRVLGRVPKRSSGGTVTKCE